MIRTREQVHAELTSNVRAAISELKSITGMSVISVHIDLVDVSTFRDVRVETALTNIRITYE